MFPLSALAGGWGCRPRVRVGLCRPPSGLPEQIIILQVLSRRRPIHLIIAHYFLENHAQCWVNVLCMFLLARTHVRTREHDFKNEKLRIRELHFNGDHQGVCACACVGLSSGCAALASGYFGIRF